MPINVKKLTDRELQNLIANHRGHKATDRPIYLDALAEDAKRKGGGLTFDKSREVILKAGGQGSFS